MACACLVLFSGFLFVGESSKTDAIFQLLAAGCLGVIFVSVMFISHVVFLKLEEALHCWNCRKVPIVAAPKAKDINHIARTIRTEIHAGHNKGVMQANGVFKPTPKVV
jgi:hypothetical protein